MIEYWATLGRGCVDGRFRDALVSVLGPGGIKPLSELGEPSGFLRGTHKLRLSAWELKEIEYVFRTEAVEAMAVLEKTWGGWAATFPDDREVCALVGLACLDEPLRSWLFEHVGSAGELDRALRAGNRDLYPAFELSKEDALRLHTMLTSGSGVEGLMAAVAGPIWRAPCPVGYALSSAGKPYIHVDSRQVLDAVETRGHLEEVLEEGEISERIVVEIVETVLRNVASLVSRP